MSEKVSFCAALFARTVDLDAFPHIQIIPPGFELMTHGYSYVHVNGPSELFLFCDESYGFGICSGFN